MIQFKSKKEIFDKAATRLTCSTCKVVCSTIQIFQTGQGDVLCWICKRKSKLPGIFRSSSLEDLRRSITISCKYQKNECDYKCLNPENLANHEEDCDYRDVSCYYDFCEERIHAGIPASQFKKHCLQKHGIVLECPLVRGHVCQADHLVQFKAQKEKYDKIAPRLTCSNCKHVIRGTCLPRPDYKVFQTGQGDVLCQVCQPNSKEPGIYRSYILEKLIRSLPDPCHYHKQGCPVVLDKDEIEILCDHETECEFRDFLCSYGFCEERIVAREFKRHCLEKHELDLEIDTAEVSETGVCKLIDTVEERNFDSEWSSSNNKVIRFNDSNSFIFHITSQYGCNFFWLQNIGSRFEAMDFEYSVKVDGPSHIGKFYYEGNVRDLDEDKNELFDKGLGLVIYHGALKTLVRSEGIHTTKKQRRLWKEKSILGQYSIEVTIKQTGRISNSIVGNSDY